MLPQLPLYLPGNGGLLFAVALMAAGWQGAPPTHAPGFPTSAKGWVVRHEGLRCALSDAIDERNPAYSQTRNGVAFTT